MKKIIMLKPTECASRDTRKFGIYQVTNDYLVQYNHKTEEQSFYYYTKENLNNYPDAERWIEIKDETDYDSFKVYDNEDRFVVCENDKELARALIDFVDGLDKAIVNMASMFLNVIK